MLHSKQYKQEQAFTKVIPIWKFCLLSIITYNLYAVIWFVQNKELIKKLKANNFLRTNLSIPFGVGWFTMIALCEIYPTYKPLFLMLLFVPIFSLLNPVNTYWRQEEGGDLPRKKFTWWQLMLIMLWVAFLALFCFLAYTFSG